jgi:ABC-2 type transport system permease protein
MVQIFLLCVLLFALQRLHFNQINWIVFLLGITLTAVTCSALGLVTAVMSKSLDNFAAIMNFVIFPVFFLSGALYPIQNLPTALHWIAIANPFSYGVDLIKHSIDAKNINPDFSLHVSVLALIGFSTISIAFASWKFSQEDTLTGLINKLTAGKR